jgi:hypothetical protein
MGHLKDKLIENQLANFDEKLAKKLGLTYKEFSEFVESKEFDGKGYLCIKFREDSPNEILAKIGGDYEVWIIEEEI